MEIVINISESEILNNPNDSDLGEYIRKLYWEKRKKIESSFVEYDHCVICGKISPYTKETHIFNRIGYIEGGGQGCFSPINCEK